MNNIVFAVDIGGTNIRAAAVSAEGKVLHAARTATHGVLNPDALLEALTRMANECATAASADA